MSYLIFARKYRPQTFEEMIGQKSVVQTLQNAIRTNRVTQAYLFSGMRGTGKTTAARILAKALNCVEGPTPTPCNVCEYCVAINEDRSIDVLEIDGASSGGIDQIRTLRESLRYKPIHSRNKVIIIDEVHQVTGPAFNALLKTLEEPPAGTVFIFATTEFNKVPATIVSRCQHFEFKKISRKEIINHLMDIAKKENITISPNGLGLIADASEGSLRDAQSLLDQAVAFSGEVVNDEDLKEILGLDRRRTSSTRARRRSSRRSRRPCSPSSTGSSRAGTDLRVFFKELIEHFRNLLLVRSVEDARDILFLNGPELERLQRGSREGLGRGFPPLSPGPPAGGARAPILLAPPDLPGIPAGQALPFPQARSRWPISWPRSRPCEGPAGDNEGSGPSPVPGIRPASADLRPGSGPEARPRGSPRRKPLVLAPSPRTRAPVRARAGRSPRSAKALFTPDPGGRPEGKAGPGRRHRPIFLLRDQGGLRSRSSMKGRGSSMARRSGATRSSWRGSPRTPRAGRMRLRLVERGGGPELPPAPGAEAARGGTGSRPQGPDGPVLHGYLQGQGRLGRSRQETAGRDIGDKR